MTTITTASTPTTLQSTTLHTGNLTTTTAPIVTTHPNKDKRITKVEFFFFFF